MQVSALDVLVRAWLLYPQWPTVCYRFAATVRYHDRRGLVVWASADLATKESIYAALAGLDASAPRRKPLVDALRGNDMNTQRHELCNFAEELLDANTMVGAWHVVWRALRRTERSYWLGMFRTRTRHVSHSGHAPPGKLRAKS